MFYCPKCQPHHQGGYGYSIAFCDEHKPERPAYISSSEAARQLDVTPGRIRQLLHEDRIFGAVKVGRDWMIPSGFTVAPPEH